MNFIETHDITNTEASTVGEIVDAFNESRYEQVEIIDWNDRYTTLTGARSAFVKIVTTKYAGTIAVKVKNGKLYLIKRSINNMDYDTTTSSTKRFVGIKECARITGLSLYYIRDGVKKGIIPVLMSGSKYLIDMDKFNKTMDQLSLEIKK